MLPVPAAADHARPGTRATSRADRSPRARRAAVLVPGLSAVLAAAGFLPWIASGRATYSSFAFASLVRRIALVDGAAAVVPTAWLLVPVLAAAVLVAFLLRFDRVANVVAAVLVVIALAAVGATIVAARSAALGLLIGVPVALVAAVLLGAVLLLGAGGVVSLVRVAVPPRQEPPRDPRP